MKKILYICTGNICRSSTAEAISRQLVSDLGFDKKFHFDSAGVTNMHSGESSDPRSIEIAQEKNVNFDNIYSRQVANSDFTEFDHILCMDKFHLNKMLELSDSQHHHKIGLFLDFAGGFDYGSEVEDPYYSGDESFITVFDKIYQGVKMIITKLS